MSKNNLRVFHLNDEDYQFNTTVFRNYFDKYKSCNNYTVSEAETNLAQLINVEPGTIHSWRYRTSGPADIQIIKNLSFVFEINNHMILLSKKEDNKMTAANERTLDSLKKIYDVIIEFLHEFKETDGFTMYWNDIEHQVVINDLEYNPQIIENNLYNMVEDKVRSLELTLQKEYIILHKYEIFNKLEDYIYNIWDIFDGKLNPIYRFEAGVENIDGSHDPTTYEDYEVALNNINDIMSEYF